MTGPRRRAHHGGEVVWRETVGVSKQPWPPDQSKACERPVVAGDDGIASERASMRARAGSPLRGICVSMCMQSALLASVWVCEREPCRVRGRPRVVFENRQNIVSREGPCFGPRVRAKRQPPSVSRTGSRLPRANKPSGRSSGGPPIVALSRPGRRRHHLLLRSPSVASWTSAGLRVLESPVRYLPRYLSILHIHLQALRDWSDVKSHAGPCWRVGALSPSTNETGESPPPLPPIRLAAANLIPGTFSDLCLARPRRLSDNCPT